MKGKWRTFKTLPLQRLGVVKVSIACLGISIRCSYWLQLPDTSEVLSAHCCVATDMVTFLGSIKTDDLKGLMKRAGTDRVEFVKLGLDDLSDEITRALREDD